MSTRTGAFLGLWNDCSPTRADYDVWHTREHLPERLSVPGIVSARRYRYGNGPLPPYLTLYDLENLQVLSSPAYRGLLENPSEWTASMRPDLSRFLRLGCRSVASLGGGIGGELAVCMVGIDLTARASLHDKLQDVVAIDAVNSVQLGTIDFDVQSVPFETGGTEALPAAANGVLLVEIFTGGNSCLRAAGGPLAAAGLSQLSPWTTYSLAFAVDRNMRETIIPARGHALC